MYVKIPYTRLQDIKLELHEISKEIFREKNHLNISGKSENPLLSDVDESSVVKMFLFSIYTQLIVGI